jgi:RimJ/RimL family protein N-acetyltransferase
MSSAERSLETERLILRRWRDEDLDALAAMNADPEVMRYIGDGHAQDRAETAEIFPRMRARWDEYGFGRWAVELKEDGAVIGFAGLSFPLSFPDLATIPEIGWRLARPYWGKGYATEAAAASRDDFFRSFAYDQIISLAYAGNTASTHVMDKIGFRRDGETRGVGGRPVLVYRLDRADWRPAA